MVCIGSQSSREWRFVCGLDVLFAFGMGAKGAKVKRGHGNDGTSSAS